MTEARRVRVALDGTVHTGRRESDQIVLDDGRTIAESDAVYLAPVTPSKIIAVHLTYRSGSMSTRRGSRPSRRTS